MTQATLTRFLLISLLAHAGLLLSWPDTPPAPVTTVVGPPPLQLALEAPPLRKESEPADGPKSSVVVMTPVLPPRSAEVIAAAREAPREAAPPDVLSPMPGQAADPMIRNPVPNPVGEAEIRARIGEAVETHFYYPPLARRRGWEGEVMVGVRVDGDGRLSAIDVVASSGYRVLDSAAVDSLTRLARLPESVDLPAAGIEVTVPVRYRLIDRPV